MTGILVMGIGNTLLSDEGLGVHVVERLQQQGLPAEVDCMDAGTMSFTLLAPIAEVDGWIVVDAAQLSEPAGTVRTFIDHEMDAFLSHARRTAHSVGLLDLMDMARLTDALPAKRALIGIQPDDMNWGDAPSPACEASVDVAADAVRAVLEGWGVLPFSDLSKSVADAQGAPTP